MFRRRLIPRREKADSSRDKTALGMTTIKMECGTTEVVPLPQLVGFA
jgi:hypothetical protein